MQGSRYVDHDTLVQLIDQQRFKPTRPDKSIDWSKGFDAACDFIAGELRVVELPIQPGDTVECIELEESGPQILSVGSRHVVEAVGRNSLQLELIQGWRPKAAFKRVDAVKLDAIQIKLPRGPKVYEAVAAQSRIINGEPTPKHEAGDRKPWPVPVAPAVILPGDTVRCISTEPGWPIVLCGLYEVHAISKDMLSLRGEAGWWPMTAFERLGITKEESAPSEAPRQPAVYTEGAIPITDEWVRVQVGDTLREGDMINFGCDPKNGIKPIDRESVGLVLRCDGYSHFYRSKERAQLIGLAKSYAVVGDHMDGPKRVEVPKVTGEHASVPYSLPGATNRQMEQPKFHSVDNVAAYSHANDKGFELPRVTGEHASVPRNWELTDEDFVQQWLCKHFGWNQNAVAEQVNPNTYQEWLLERTHVVEYNPNCPKPFMVRLCGKGRPRIDKLHPQESQDAIGYGATLTEAVEQAMSKRPEYYNAPIDEPVGQPVKPAENMLPH